jgi:hypothetical protein
LQTIAGPVVATKIDRALTVTVGHILPVVIQCGLHMSMNAPHRR